jgi:UDP-3-O-[3-hydroxymyristoyl] glucosamine N-acyltransferase
MPHATFLKAQAVIPQLPELRRRVKELEERVQALESAPASHKQRTQKQPAES